jgi:SAM-dependent methyltransferase
MKLVKGLLKLNQRLWTARSNPQVQVNDEPRMIAEGWDGYAEAWTPTKFDVLPGSQVKYLGDEWTGEDSSNGSSTYGLLPAEVARFNEIIRTQLLDAYLPPNCLQGLEIGPGGGRLTALLVPRAQVLHLADPSQAMLGHLRKRFAGISTLQYYHTDGMTLPQLPEESLDFVISFDVFVHFEPRLIYWYLRQIQSLLKPGGVGVLHYATVLSPLGWRQFEMDLVHNVKGRAGFSSFGVMCPPLMEKFLNMLGLTVISSDVGLIPRDAIAVFRKGQS